MRKITSQTFRGFTVYTVPQLKDNYSYVIHDHAQNTAAVVDPSTAGPVVEVLERHKLSGSFVVLTTHKHWDHTGGNKELSAKYGSSNQGFKIYGHHLDNTEGAAITEEVKDGSEFMIGALKVQVLHTPFHTKGHVLYLVSSDSGSSGSDDTQQPTRAIFTGDTLFCGGVGALFEGKYDDLLKALSHILDKVPDDAHVYPGHEYTLNFVEWSASVDKDNSKLQRQLQQYKEMRKQDLPTVPSTIAEEKVQNLFLRYKDEALRKIIGMDKTADDVAVLDKIYNMCP